MQAALAGSGATVLFVLLWSSGAIFAEIGVQHVPAFAFLVGRFTLASLVLAGLGLRRGRWWPAPGSRLKVAAIGALLTGGYSICYLLALDRGLTPGPVSYTHLTLPTSSERCRSRWSPYH